MSTTRAVQPSTSTLASSLWNKAAARVQGFMERLVVPVASTEEMSDVWKLYRLTPSAKPVRGAMAATAEADAGR